MNQEDVIREAKRIQALARSFTGDYANGLLAEAQELVMRVLGSNSPFFDVLAKINPLSASSYIAPNVESAMASFIRALENGMFSGESLERKAKMDVVSDFLEQAQQLLEDKSFHPAASAILVAAALEEFLRNWVESEGLTIGNQRPGIDAYKKTLREKDLISKQDEKDITSWAGLRNHAVHGQWEEVSDRQRVAIMLEGANLFMRRYGAA